MLWVTLNKGPKFGGVCDVVLVKPVLQGGGPLLRDLVLLRFWVGCLLFTDADSSTSREGH